MTPTRLRVRRALERLDNPELRQARRLVRRLRRGDVDVVYISESTATFVGIDDGDPRHLGQMVIDELAPAHTALVAGPGYLSDLLASYVHLVGEAEQLPVVVHPLWVRGTFLPWVRNPIYERSRSGAAVRALDPHTPPWRIRGSFPRLRDFTEHEQLPHPTLAGDLKVCDYTGPLRARGAEALAPRDHARLLYAYHHAATPSPAGLASVRQLGAALAALGCRTVAYETPISVETGVDLLGEEFAPLHAANMRMVDEAYLDGLGRPGIILPTTASFSPDEFVDPWDGSEHLNGAGRARFAHLIADAVNQVLAQPVSP